MVGAGYAVDVMALDDGRGTDAATADGVVLHAIGTRKYRGSSKLAYIGAYLAFAVRLWLAITRRVVGQTVDMVYVNNPPDFLVFAAIAARMRGIPVVLDVHDMTSDLYAAKFHGSGGPIGRVIDVVQRASFRFADALVTIHDIYRDRIQAVVGSKPVVGVWNVPDATGWVEAGDARAAAPEQPGPLRLGHHGTIVERFGTDRALLAVARLRQRGLAVTLDILGDGDFADRLQRRIAELGLGDAVRFERRAFTPEDLPRFVGGIDVGIAPYAPSQFAEHGLPTKVLEYLALGVPSVVTGTEMIRRHLAGAVRVIGGASVDEIADAIAELADPAVRHRYRQAGRPLAHRYAWATQRADLLDLVGRLLDHRS
jgi:glycosyltransferase involved in cell wall biosynthesis